jgi:heme ABC exporter ATP-binding subunit CcmA
VSQAPHPLLEARGLVKRYGHFPALRGLDVTLQAGELLAVFGPNGAGKTTLLRLLATAARPTEGTLSFRGRSVAEDPAALRRVLGYVSHESLLYHALSPRENLMFTGKLHGLDDLRARVDEVLARVELSDRADSPVRELSRGLRQRASVARALLADPELVLLDEPFTGLDRQAARVLRKGLETLREQGRTVVLVTHDLSLGLELADRLLVLQRGRLALERRAEGIEAAAFEDLYLETLGAGRGAA